MCYNNEMYSIYVLYCVHWYKNMQLIWQLARLSAHRAWFDDPQSKFKSRKLQFLLFYLVSGVGFSQRKTITRETDNNILPNWQLKMSNEAIASIQRGREWCHVRDLSSEKMMRNNNKMDCSCTVYCTTTCAVLYIRICTVNICILYSALAHVAPGSMIHNLSSILERCNFYCFMLNALVVDHLE